MNNEGVYINVQYIEEVKKFDDESCEVKIRPFAHSGHGRTIYVGETLSHFIAKCNDSCRFVWLPFKAPKK